MIVCGFPFDFRLGYGRGINKRATLIAANLSAHELRKNRRPDVAVEMHAGDFLVALGDKIGSAGDRWRPGSRGCARRSGRATARSPRRRARRAS